MELEILVQERIPVYEGPNWKRIRDHTYREGDQTDTRRSLIIEPPPMPSRAYRKPSNIPGELPRGSEDISYTIL
jgi:hypothetical protein